jgi:sugar/nucleoside kinase (ribokinase family)
MNDFIDAVVCGHLCLDLIPDIKHLPGWALTAAGRLFESGPIGISTGGAVSNTGLALHRLGVDVRLMSIVGDDLLGQVIINYLKARDSLLTEYVLPIPGQPSSATIVLQPEKADRTFLHCAGTNAVFNVEHIQFELAERTRIFHLGYPPLLPKLIEENGEELKTIFEKVKRAGAVTSLDMVMPDPQALSGQVNWPLILDKALPYVDIFIPSIDEILFMLRRADWESWKGDTLAHLSRSYLAELADELLNRGVAITGFKLGEMGIYLKCADAERLAQLERISFQPSVWANIERWQPAYHVRVAGTTGAGDSAYAGFLAAVLRECGPEDALRWACAAGACNVEAVDSTSGVRTWDETAERLAGTWTTRPERLRGF